MRRKPKVAIDLRVRSRSGVHRYCSEVAGRMARLLATDFEVLLVTDGPVECRPGAGCEQLSPAALRSHVVDAYFSFNYIHQPDPAPTVGFVLYDLIRYHAPGDYPQMFGTSSDASPGGFRDVLRRQIAADDLIVTISETSRDAIIREWPKAAKKMVVARPGVGEPFASAPLSPAVRESYLIVGRAHPHKRHRWLVEALTNRLGIDPSAIRIIGTDLERLDEVVLFSGARIETRMKDTDLLEAYDSARCLVVASEAEGWHLPSAEAAARGCPVVSPHLPVFKENLEGYSGWFPYCPNTPGSFESSILAASSVTPDRYVARTWDETAAQIAEHFQRTVAAKWR